MSGPQDSSKRMSGSKPDAEPTIGEKESQNFDELIKGVAGGPANRGAVINAGGLSTRAVHGGERCKGGLKARATLDALATPIVQTATFTFRNTAEIVGYNEGNYPSFEYGRYGNPTVRAAEEKIMALEGADDCVVSASGMNAVTTMLLALVDTVFFTTATSSLTSTCLDCTFCEGAGEIGGRGPPDFGHIRQTKIKNHVRHVRRGAFAFPCGTLAQMHLLPYLSDAPCRACFSLWTVVWRRMATSSRLPTATGVLVSS
jgi:hypothetical protein